jgi:protein PhnA
LRVFIVTFVQNLNKMAETPCPVCGSEYPYPSGLLMICPECAHEWNPEEVLEEVADNDTLVIKDSNGTILKDGDSVVVIKDLPVKGFSKSIKVGTKVNNIRLTDGDHNIDCKIGEFGAMSLKSEFVKKA